MSQKKHKELRRKLKDKSQKFKVENDNIGILDIIKNNWKFLLILSLGIVGLYLNSLRGNFVSDDYATISQNPLITDFQTSVAAFKFNLVTSSNYVIANLFGNTNPVPYHVYSLLLYLLTCVAAFIFIALLFNQKIAVAATILFALLPVHVEAVSWISGKPYLLSSLFVLTSLSFLILYSKTIKFSYFIYMLLAFLLAFQADRVRSLAFVLIAFPYLWLFKEEHKLKIDWLKLLTVFGGVALASALVLWPAISERIGNVNSGYNMSSEGIFYDPFFQYPTAITKYLQLILVPTDLTLYHTMYQIIPHWLNWLTLISYLLLVVVSFFKSKKIFFALIFIFLATAPSMAPVKVSWLVAERYVFLGSLGFCILLAYLVEKLDLKAKGLSTVFLIIIGLIYSYQIVKRNIDWQTNHNLWVKTVQVSPNSHNAWNNIGDDYDKLKQYDNAIKGFTQSTVVKPNYADAYHNRANIFYKIGRLDLARESYETALKFSPTLYQTHLSLVQIGMDTGNGQYAFEHAQKLVELQQNNPMSYYVYGVVMARAGQIDESRKAMEIALKLNPNYKQAKDFLLQLKQ